MEPRVTVIVLAYKNTDHLKRCIDSLLADDSAPEFKIRILLNAVAGDECEEIRKRYDTATVIASDVNLGFGGGCNHAARNAQTEFLAFINDDAVVTRGWLRALISCADRSRESAAIGSRILFPGGILQEAGSVVWCDGSTAPVGRGLPVQGNHYNAVRETDFCSANGLLVRTSDWLAVNGFDEQFYPAYYEDVDLCFNLRHRFGRKVLYEPRSVIVHEESRSSEAAFRAFLFKKQQEYFVSKWSNELTAYLPPSTGLRRAVFHTRKVDTTVLFVDDRFPDASLGSGFGRFGDIGKDLEGSSFATTFLATAERARAAHCLTDFGIETTSHVPSISAIGPFDVVIASRPHNYVRYVERAQRGRDMLRVYDAEALFHLRLARKAAREENAGKQKQIIKAAEEMRAIERRIVGNADLVVCTSADEEMVIRSLGAKRTILQLPLNRAITPTAAPFARRSGVAFAAGWLGGSDSPNLAALEWFVNQVLPYLRAHAPSLRVRVSGRNPPAEALALASPQLSFTGNVDDISDVYNSARVMIAPVVIGAGTKVKTVESLQHAVPIVATAIGAEGLPAPMRALIDVADEPEAFASAIVRLATDEAYWLSRRTESASLMPDFLATQPTWRDILDSL